jgi:hypothetical protein
MKKAIFVFILTGICCSNGFSQKIKNYTVQPGENILEIIPKADMYEYPQFEKGFIYFRSGAKSTSRVNYNFIYEEIFFINMKGDTLTLNNPEEVKMLTIGDDIFYLAGKRFVKSDTAIGEIRLAVATFFATVSKRKIGAYGTTTDAASDSYSTYVMPNEVKLDLIPQVVTTIERQQALFIGNRFNQFQLVNRQNIFSLYAEKEVLLKKYLKENKVNFSSRQQIINLIVYMNNQ